MSADRIKHLTYTIRIVSVLKLVRAANASRGLSRPSFMLPPRRLTDVTSCSHPHSLTSPPRAHAHALSRTISHHDPPLPFHTPPSLYISLPTLPCFTFIRFPQVRGLKLIPVFRAVIVFLTLKLRVTYAFAEVTTPRTPLLCVTPAVQRCSLPYTSLLHASPLPGTPSIP